MARPIAKAHFFLPPTWEATKLLAEGVYFDTVRLGTWLEPTDDAADESTRRQFELGGEIAELLGDIESSFLDACATYNSYWAGMLRLAILNGEIQQGQFDQEWKLASKNLPEWWVDKDATAQAAVKFGIDTRRIHQSRNLYQRTILRLAEACILSISQFGKSLTELTKIDATNSRLLGALSVFSQRFDKVFDMRNSISHRESRAQQKGPKSGRDPIPYMRTRVRDRFETDAVERGIDGTNYIITIEDGSVASLALTPETLGNLEQCLKEIFSSYKWSGPSYPLEYSGFVD